MKKLKRIPIESIQKEITVKCRSDAIRKNREPTLKDVSEIMTSIGCAFAFLLIIRNNKIANNRKENVTHFRKPIFEKNDR